MSRGDRGQVVLLAAAVVVVALVPMLLAYAQLGYLDDAAAGETPPAPETDALRLLRQAVAEAAGEVDGDTAWADRKTAADRANATLDSRVSRIETARIADGVAVGIEQNATAATRWAAANCPSGPMRRFGPCEADGGVILQERAGEATLVAVAYDVRANATGRSVRLTRVVGATAG